MLLLSNPLRKMSFLHGFERLFFEIHALFHSLKHFWKFSKNRGWFNNLIKWHIFSSYETWSTYSPFTKLWQRCSDPYLKIRPIAIFAFYSLNYSLAARLQDNSRPKSPTKVETKGTLQQFTASGWLIMNGGESGNEKKKENVKVEIIFYMKRQHNY